LILTASVSWCCNGGGGKSLCGQVFNEVLKMKDSLCVNGQPNLVKRKPTRILGFRGKGGGSGLQKGFEVRQLGQEPRDALGVTSGCVQVTSGVGTPGSRKWRNGEAPGSNRPRPVKKTPWGTNPYNYRGEKVTAPPQVPSSQNKTSF